MKLLLTVNTCILFLAAYMALFQPSYVWSLICLIITFTAGALHLLYIGGLDLSACIYIVVCSSGMGVLLLWIVMTLSLKKEIIETNYGTSRFRFLYFFFLFFSPLAFLKFLWIWMGYFDLIYLYTSLASINYTYKESFGTNLVELGSYLYLEDPFVVYLGGLILFFALIAAVFLTTDNTKSVAKNSVVVLGGGMVDTLDLGSSAYAWGFKSLPSNYSYDTFYFFCLLGIITILLVVGVLITVAFFTLGERKIMGGIQRRKGPNVVGFYGVLQPIMDGLKLVLKENIIPVKADKRLFFLAPIISFVLAFSLWSFIPFSQITLIVDSSISILCLFAISSLGIYGIILGGWASNSKYAFLGALRTTAQMISYEIVLGTVYLMLATVVGSLNLLDIVAAQKDIWFIVPFWPFVIIFGIAMLAETNRAPFDLPEAEAEIVAGYNVEYSGIAFAFYFLAEYSNMLLFSSLFAILFLGGGETFFFILKSLVIASFFVIIRAALPRLRYDQLMLKSWTILLPILFGGFIVLFFFFVCFF